MKLVFLLWVPSIRLLAIVHSLDYTNHKTYNMNFTIIFITKNLCHNKCVLLTNIFSDQIMPSVSLLDYTHAVNSVENYCLLSGYKLPNHGKSCTTQYTCTTLACGSCTIWETVP